MSHNGNDDDGQGDISPNSINSKPNDNDKKTQMFNNHAYTHNYTPIPDLVSSSEADNVAWHPTEHPSGICPLVAD
eukprot:4528954-Karenia_brevis.AAC.1